MEKKSELKNNHFKRLWPMYLSFVILLGYTIFFLLKGNFEFMTYATSIIVIILAIGYSDKIFLYPISAKLGFAIWLFLHFLGGSLKLNGIRLYDTILVPIIGEPLNIFRYDQLMHFVCYVVFAIFVYAIVKKSLVFTKYKYSKIVLFFVVVLVAEGISAVNEIIELFNVITFHSIGVGDYFNNALDLVFNITGAIVGTWIAFSFDKNDKK